MMSKSIRNNVIGAFSPIKKVAKKIAVCFENKKYKRQQNLLIECQQIIDAPWDVTEQEAKMVHRGLCKEGFHARARELKAVWEARDFVFYSVVVPTPVCVPVVSECDVLEKDVAFEGIPRRRPVVVIDNEVKEPTWGSRKWQVKLQNLFEKSRIQEKKDQRRRNQPVNCPYSQIPQKDCWCLHKEHAKECLDCGVVYLGECCFNSSVHDPIRFSDDSSSCYDSSNSDESSDEGELEYPECIYCGSTKREKCCEPFDWKEDFDRLCDSTSLCSVQEMSDPNENFDAIEIEQGSARFLIHLYLRDAAWNLHSIIHLWTYEYVDLIRGLSVEILSLIRKLNKLVTNKDQNFIDWEDTGDSTLAKQKERMFVYTGNIALLLSKCNKIVNDNKELHKIRGDFLLYSKTARVKLGSIRTYVNEARGFIAVQEMQNRGDSNFSMPHNKPADRVAFTNDKARDENSMFKLGKLISIVDVVERCKIPSRLDIITFSTASPAATALARYRVTPNYCPRYVDGGGNRTYNQTALCNYANIYQFWKGSIVYTFEVIRTSFHMGQIYIAFNPASDAAPTFIESRNNLFKIMDLKEKNCMDFEVEYVAETEWKQCISTAQGPTVPTDPYDDISSVGILSVFVYTPLTAPNIVSGTVEINVYVRAGDNFQFAAPRHKIPTLTYYNVRAKAYQEMETDFNSELPPVVAQPPQGTVANAEKLEIARAAKLDTADTENIGARAYPLAVGIAWDTTDTINTGPLYTVVLPRDVLNAAQLSINGIVNYHAFFRGTFTIIFQMDAPLQYSGMLIIFFVPNDVDYTETSDSTWTQFPHVKFNPANETIAELEIPWSYVTPMSNLDANGSLNTMGRVFIKVWNNLQIPVSGVNTLTGALSFRINEPKFLVKRTKFTYAADLDAVQEMGEPVSGGGSTTIKQTSDSAKKTEEDVGVFQGKPVTKEALMVLDHHSIINLLKRVDFAPTQGCTSVVTANWQQILKLPPFFGVMHSFLRNSFAFSNGSNKITFVVPVGANRGVTLAAYPSFTDSTFSDTISATSSAVANNVVFYQGSSVWRPGLALEHTIDVPYYHRDPVISIPDVGEPSQCEYASVYLNAFSNDSATDVFVQPGHSVGDDFKLYFPIAFGKFRGPIPARSRDEEELQQLAPPPWRNEGAREIAQIYNDQRTHMLQSSNPSHSVTFPEPPVVNVPRAVVDKVVNHLAAKSGLPKAAISDIGIKSAAWNTLKDFTDAYEARRRNKILHVDMATALGNAFSFIGRRKRDLRVCEKCVNPRSWPDSVPIPLKKNASGNYVYDYNSVYIHCHHTVDCAAVARTFVIPNTCDAVRDLNAVLEMPSGGVTGVTTNTQTISQSFPGIFTVGQVNVTTFVATATLTSASSTDLVDVEYTISNAGDYIQYVTTVAGNGAGASVTFGPITFNSTPISTLSTVTVIATGTGVVEHSFNIQSYPAAASSSVLPVTITGQPIRVTEYGFNELDSFVFRRRLAMAKHHLDWLKDNGEFAPWSTPESYLKFLEFEGLPYPGEGPYEEGDDEVDFVAVQEMPGSDDEYEDAPGWSQADEDEAEAMSRSFCQQITDSGGNIISVFRNAFTGILSWINSKCSNTVKRTACERIRARLQEISNNVLDKIIPVVIWLVDFIANLYVLFNTENTTMRTLMIASITAKCILAYREGTQLVDKLEELLGVTNSGVRGVLEGPIDENLPLVAGLVASAMLAGILGILGYNVLASDVADIRKLSTWKFAESCAMLSKISSVAKSVPTLWTAAYSGINAVIQYFIEGSDCFKNWEEKNHEKLIKWQCDVDLGIKNNLFVNANLFKNSSQVGKTNYQHLQDLADYATEIRTFGSSVPRFNQVWLRSAEAVLKMHAVAVKTMQTAKGRSEPVGIIIRGPAGCGKSLLFTQFLPHAVMSTLGLSKSLEQSQQQTYAKPTDPKADFWDGYLGEQHIWVNVDDFGQVRSEEDVGSMYNLISASDASVNMAALEEKGILFVSDFVCCTTNLATFKELLTIRDSKALVRRFPISLQCEVKKSFQKDDGTLDHTKMIALLKKSGKTASERYAAMDRVWEFKEYNFFTNNSGSVVFMSEVVRRIADAYTHRKRGLSDFSSLVDEIDFTNASVGNLLGGAGSVSNLVAQKEMPGRRTVGHILREYDPLDSSSDSDDDVFTPNPITNRKDFISRVLAANPCVYNIKYHEAQSFLREIKYLDKLKYFNVSEKDFKEAADDPTYFVKDWDLTSRSFLIVVARLRNIKESQIGSDLPVLKWEGIVKFCLKWMGVISCGVVAALLLRKMFTVLFAKVVDPLGVPEGPHYDNSKAMRTRAPAKVPITTRTFKAVTQMDERQNVVSHNIRFIRLHLATTTYTMNCIALDSRHIVMPEHYFTCYEDARNAGDHDAHFELEIRRKTIVDSTYMPINVSVHNSVRLNGVDSFADKKLDARLIFLNGAPCVGAKSIWSHVMTIDNFSQYAHSRQLAYLLAPQSGLIGQRVVLDYGHAYLHKDSRTPGGNFHILGKMAISSQKGDCGRPYVHSSIHAQHCLLGMHTVGIKEQPDINIAMTPLIRESLDEAKSYLAAIFPPPLHVESFVVAELEGVKIDPVPPMVEELWKEKTMPLIGKLTIHGQPLERFVPQNTKFLPIVVADKPFVHPNWRNEFLPSVKKAVKVGDTSVHPLFTGAQKYACKATRVVPLKYTINALEHYCKRLAADPNARILSDDEAINGFGELGHLVMTTGAGYFGTWFSKGKSEIFQPKTQRLRSDGSLEVLEYEWSEKARTFVIPIWKKTIVDFYSFCENEINQGRQMPTFWVSTLKDELLSLEKVRIAKTRVFEQPCVVYSLLCRKYFGYFAEYFKRHAGFRLHHGIGKDKNVVWGRYLEILSQKGGYGFDVDYKNYDGTVQPAAFEFFLSVTDHFYGPNGRTARHSLISTLQNSMHLIGATLAESFQGNKSGNPLTDLFNSITNVWLVYVVYQMTREMNGLSCDMYSQPEDFDFLTYGDDVIIAATETCLEYFNRVNFAQIASFLGMTVTAANKSDVIVPYENIYDLTFLKSPFVPRVGYVAAPLPMKVIYRELMWETKACVGDQTIFNERVKNALEFMAHHGEEAYQKLRLELGQLGVHTEDRFAEWENEMREKQLVPDVEDGMGRFYVDADDFFLEAEPELEEMEIDWEADSWLYGVEEGACSSPPVVSNAVDEPPPLTYHTVRAYHCPTLSDSDWALMRSVLQYILDYASPLHIHLTPEIADVMLFRIHASLLLRYYFRIINRFGFCGFGLIIIFTFILYLIYFIFVLFYFY